MSTRARSWSMNTSMVPRRAGREAATGGPPRVGIGEGVDKPAGPSEEEERRRLRAGMERRAIATAKSKSGKRNPEKYVASMITF